MEIEESLSAPPEQILTANVHPTTGLQPFQCKQLAFGLGLTGKEVEQFQAIALALYRLYTECDASLIEIKSTDHHPQRHTRGARCENRYRGQCAISPEEPGGVARHRQEDPMERRASEHDLNYVSLDGDIACMVTARAWQWPPWT